MASFYYGLTKQVIGQFGAFFSDLHIIRRLCDSVRGRIGQDIKVPISYAPKEKWWQAFNSDPARLKQVAVTLPRMSFEILGYSYDNTRKTTRSADIKCLDTETNTVHTMSTPAPWNLEIGLYLVANNQEDIFQMLEQILPLFNPDRTIKIKAVPALNIVENVPISLTSIAVEDSYDGDYATHRVIVYTLTFTVRMNYYGQITDKAPIYNVSIDTDANGNLSVEYDPESGEISENWLFDTETVNMIDETEIREDSYKSVEIDYKENP